MKEKKREKNKRVRSMKKKKKDKNIWIIWKNIWKYMCVIKKSRNGSFVFKKFFKTKPMMKKNYEFE